MVLLCWWCQIAHGLFIFYCLHTHCIRRLLSTRDRPIPRWPISTQRRDQFQYLLKDFSKLHTFSGCRGLIIQQVTKEKKRKHWIKICSCLHYQLCQKKNYTTWFWLFEIIAELLPITFYGMDSPVSLAANEILFHSNWKSISWHVFYLSIFGFSSKLDPPENQHQTLSTNWCFTYVRNKLWSNPYMKFQLGVSMSST